jgi:hypothetical protein
MTAYAQELRRCKVVLLLRAVIDAGGNICAAARATGVHYNTIGRILKGAGYDSRRLKRLAAQRIAKGWRKPVQSEPAIAAADRKVA